MQGLCGGEPRWRGGRRRDALSAGPAAASSCAPSQPFSGTAARPPASRRVRRSRGRSGEAALRRRGAFRRRGAAARQHFRPSCPAAGAKADAGAGSGRQGETSGRRPIRAVRVPAPAPPLPPRLDFGR
eukprot:tig00000178_g12802.t1